MARYSSDSDSDRSNRHRRKHYGRSRSSSSDSSDGCYKKRLSKHPRSKRRHRTRSKSRERDRATKNYKSSRGSSKDREKRRYRSKKSYSPDGNGRKGRSPSGEKSSSRSSSAQSGVKPFGEKSTTLLLSKDEFSIEPRIKESVLEEINSESFAPKAFSSSASSKDNKFRNVVIDVSADTIQAPAVKDQSNAVESIFHTSIIMDREARFDKWVKKLYTLRQKAIIDVTHTSVT